jgi:hypothetical protein
MEPYKEMPEWMRLSTPEQLWNVMRAQRWQIVAQMRARARMRAKMGPSMLVRRIPMPVLTPEWMLPRILTQQSL